MNRKDISNITLSNHSKKEFKNFPHEDFIAGTPPYLRGINPTMYIEKPLKLISSTKYSTAEQVNKLYLKTLTHKTEELFITFDSATNNGYDSNEKVTKNIIENSGIAIDSVEDMKSLFNKIPLDKISISMEVGKAILPILAFYIVCAEEQGISKEFISGTIQNIQLNNLTKLHHESSIKVITDIVEYTSKYMPKFNAFSISNFYTKSLTETEELAYTLLNGIAHLKKGIEKNIDIDYLAPLLSFSWLINTNHFYEIAKTRACRMLWAKMVKQLNPKKPESLAFKLYCKTTNTNASEENTFNSITQNTIKGMSAIFAGTQNLNTDKDTLVFLQEETHITKTVDPWAGSYKIEELTQQIATKTWDKIQEIENNGGITKAIEKSYFGNKTDNFNINSSETTTTNNINTDAIREYQIEQIKKLKKHRKQSSVTKSLKNLIKNTQSKNINLLDLTIEAARNRATLGEITHALNNGFQKQ